jgi:flagellar FliL protein
MYLDDEKKPEGEQPAESKDGNPSPAPEAKEGEIAAAPAAATEVLTDLNQLAAKRKKTIFMAIALFAAVVIGGAAFIMISKKRSETPADQQMNQKLQMIYRDMDEILVNLNTENRSVSFMKLKVTLEIEGKGNLDVVNQMMPRITDVFQVYLREMRPQDLQGSVGLYRLREELLLRVNKIIYPAKINDILFNEVLVQ